MITSEIKEHNIENLTEDSRRILNSKIDFDKMHSALRDVKLLNCHGFVVRVSGLTIESSGPKVGCKGRSKTAAGLGAE